MIKDVILFWKYDKDNNIYYIVGKKYNIFYCNRFVLFVNIYVFYINILFVKLYYYFIKYSFIIM